jgi:hypothetical protein
VCVASHAKANEGWREVIPASPEVIRRKARRSEEIDSFREAIDEHMKEIAVGSEVGIEYGGMADSVKRPGKQYKKFLVGVIDDTFGEPDAGIAAAEDDQNPL